MAFVNAWITQEDWDNPQYHLWELSKKHPQVLRFEDQHAWVIDRDRNMYFIFTGKGGDREEYKTPGGYYDIWSMRWKEKFTEVRLDDDRSQTDGVYSIKWSFFGFETECYPKPMEMERKELFELIKDALTVYGRSGPYKPESNIIVTFTF